MRIYFYLLLILPVLSFGQEKFMKGQIYADSLDTYQINIINITQEIGQVSTKDGKYNIRAKVGDSILFTSLQHKTYTLNIEDNNLRTSTSIFLEMQINELEEVTILQYNLTGNLSKDIKQVETDFIDQRQFGFRVPRKLAKVERELRAAQSSSLDFLIMSLNGEMKKIKQRIEIANIKTDKNRLLRSVSSGLITTDLNIPKIYIEDFAYYCAEDKHTVSIMDKGDPLALIDELKLKAISYISLKNLKK
ncbi:hypothetical protein CXF67_11105 [Psychroflexus sp. MES1-P1E]|nr:hypothetical protein CXF67_11105 [Psychroflexus sp. MES1-P1E]